MPMNRSPRRVTTAIALLGATTAGRAFAGDMLEWDGELAPNMNWAAMSGSTTNWDPDSIPDGTTDCTARGATIRISTLQAEAKSLTMSGGMLDLLAGRILTLIDGGQIEDATIGGFLESGGFVEFSGNVVLGGALRGGGIFSSSGTLTALSASVLGDPNAQQQPLDVDNTGTMNVTGGLTLFEGTTLTNLGTLSMSGTLQGAGLTRNLGTIEQTEPGLSVIGRLTQDSGEIRVTNGTLRLAGMTQLLAGEITTAAPGQLEVRSGRETADFGGLSRISGDGTVSLLSGPLPLMTVASPMVWEVGEAFFGDAAVVIGNSIRLEATVSNRARTVWNRGGLTGIGTFVNDPLAELRIEDVAGPLAASLVNANGEVTQIANLSEGSGGTGHITNEELGTWIINRGSILPGDDPMGFTNRGTIVKRDVPGSLAEPSIIRATLAAEAGEVRVETSALTVRGDVHWIDATMRSEGAESLLNLGGPDQRFTGLTRLSGDGRADVAQFNASSMTVTLEQGAEWRNELPPVAIGSPQPLRIRIPTEVTGPGQLVNAGGMEWSAATLSGDLRNESLLDLGSMVLQGDLLNAGTVRQTNTVNGSLGGFPTITNDGDWTLATDAADILLPPPSGGPPSAFLNRSGGSLTADPGAAATVLVTNLVNNAGATVRADSGSLQIQSANNDGTITAGTGTTITFSSSLSNLGGIVAEPRGTISVTGEVLGSPALDEGTWIAFPGGTIDWDFQVESIGGAATVRGGTTSLPDLDALDRIEDGGAFQCTEDSLFTAPWTIEPGGGCDVQGGTLIDVPTIELEADDSGPGLLGEVGTYLVPADGGLPATIVTTLLTNGGRVRPGPAVGTGFARFLVIGEYVQTSSGELAIAIAGETPGRLHDVLEIEGDATFAGTLAITLADDYEPEPGTAFTVVAVSGGTITGGIDSVDAPGRWTVDVQPSTITAIYDGPDIPGDVDGDGMVAFGDLLSVLSAFGPCGDCGDCPADVNADCTVDFDDVLVVLAAWS